MYSIQHHLWRYLQNSAALFATALSVGWMGALAAPAVAENAQPEAATEANSKPSSGTEATAAAIWRGTVELYAPLPLSLDTTTTINGRTTEAELNLGDVLSNLEWTSSLRASVEIGRLGLLTDLSYSKLGTEASQVIEGGRIKITEKAKIEVIQGIYDVAIRYRFGDPESAIGQKGQFSVIPYAGVRVVDANLDVSAQVGSVSVVNGSFGRTWAQPLLGTQATVFLAPRLRAFARADIGGFGLSGSRDLSGNAKAGLGYSIGNNTELNIFWRYFAIDYNNGDSPDSGFSSYQNGLEIGLKIFF